ncbi:MAG: hypothetical protein COA88_11900 [Kordia sp.]|nr:MAG: hypothetical protein COA88_11900 [Kordia sp.]
MKYYVKLVEEFEEGYLFLIPITIILQTAIGSVAMMYLLMDNSSTTLFEMILCVSSSMAYNASILGQAKKKTVFHMLMLTLLINLSLILINLL